MGHKGKETMINTFVLSNFSLPVLVFGISVLESLKLQNKVEKIHERSLKFLVTSLERKQAFGEKTSFTPAGNFAKLLGAHWKFPGQKSRPMEVPSGFFLNTLALEIPLLF